MKRNVGLSNGLRSALTSGTLTIASCLLASSAYGTQQPSYLIEDGMQLHDGRASRQIRLTTPRPNGSMAPAWAAFKADAGGSWLALWDESTGVPTRLWGSGIPAPKASTSEQAAERLAREWLKRHLALLAPGTGISDFKLASDVVERGQRVVAFTQHHRGLPVAGGQLSFRFRNDRLFMISSQARPHVAVSVPDALVADDIARAKATAWLQKDGFIANEPATVGSPLVLALLGPNQIYGYRVVLPVSVSTKPLARFSVYVDAASGEPVAREQTLRFASGTVAFNAPVRYPGSDRQDYPATFATMLVNGGTVTSNDIGVVQFTPEATASVSVAANGQYASVSNMAGAEATALLSLPPSGTAVWNDADNPEVDAQLSSFIHTHFAKDHARTMTTSLAWVNVKLPVRVNQDDQCNAFWDGTAINFFLQSNGCENTGRLADVVYHEFGHGLHQNAIIPGSGDYESALGEGVADYYAASYTNDPAMGRGFFYSQQPLRHIDPSNSEAVWPQDIDGDPHETGLIIAGALWDMRKLLVAKYGQQEGATLSNSLYYTAIRNANDIPTMFPEILAADDDDGDLENGTPNVCEIITAFGVHGLRTIDAEAGSLGVQPPQQDGYDITMLVSGLYPQCAGDALSSTVLSWRLRRLPGMVSKIDMAGGPSEFFASIPKQDAGEVVQYDVRVNLALGSQLAFPDNPADPRYEFFVGDVIPLYCTDFETDPAADGWTHGLLSGDPSEGADDWQWDTPQGTSANGDPTQAFSGAYVYGNDLGHGEFNGLYQGNKSNYTDSPVIDVGDYKNVRLQYRRWLNVEDGFFDAATIFSHGKLVWSNFASNSDNNAQVHHRDSEWRFQDVDLSSTISADHTVQVRFQIDSDPGLEFGGWTLDDFCVVAYQAESPINTECGNGAVEVGEQCDDGNLLAGDGCDSSCQSEGDEQPPGNTPPLVVDQGCGCRTTHSNGTPHAAWLLSLLGFAALRRRRRTS